MNIVTGISCFRVRKKRPWWVSWLFVYMASFASVSKQLMVLAKDNMILFFGPKAPRFGDFQHSFNEQSRPVDLL
jgi:hypothetical protein